ncbi:MAG: MFS transporter, partial [Sulfurimonadaceae bacterium]
YAQRETIGMVLGVVTLLWFLWSLKLANPIRYGHLYIPHAKVDLEKLAGLESEHIAEWYINETENIVVVKYAKDAISEEALEGKISF